MFSKTKDYALLHPRDENWDPLMDYEEDKQHIQMIDDVDDRMSFSDEIPQRPWKVKTEYLIAMIAAISCLFVFFGCFFFIPRSPYVELKTTTSISITPGNFVVQQTFRVLNRQAMKLFSSFWIFN